MGAIRGIASLCQARVKKSSWDRGAATAGHRRALSRSTAPARNRSVARGDCQDCRGRRRPRIVSCPEMEASVATSGDSAERDPKRAAFRAGLRDMLPTFPATIAWGLVTGVAMAQSGFGLGKSYAMSTIAYAGSAQLAALPLLVAHAPVWVTVLTALMVNLRFAIYSAALQPTLGHLPLRRRCWLAYLIGDMTFVIFMRSGTRQPAALRPAYFVGLSIANFLPWHVGSYAGLLAAGRIPPAWGLDFAGMLALLALLVPMLGNRPALAGCLTAGTLGIALDPLPARIGLVLATLAGIAAALVTERLRRRRA
jgi:branched chain amino acid efflux pump